MLKTKSRSTTNKSKLHSRAGRGKKKAVQLTAEQQARLVALDKFAKDKQEYWDSLSEAEKQAELESWDRIMNRMNEDRKGYRLVFVDP